MLQRVLNTAHRRSFKLRQYDLEVLAEKAQYDLFRKSYVITTEAWPTTDSNDCLLACALICRAQLVMATLSPSNRL